MKHPHGYDYDDDFVVDLRNLFHPSMLLSSKIIVKDHKRSHFADDVNGEYRCER